MKEQEILKVTKKEVKELEHIWDLLLSEDTETAKLGLNFLIEHPFYQRCKTESLINDGGSNNFYDLIVYIKRILHKNKNLLSCPILPIKTLCDIIHDWDFTYVKRLVKIDPIDPNEIELLNTIFSDLFSFERNRSDKLLLETNTIKNCKDLLYKDSWHKGYSYLSHFLIFKEKETRYTKYYYSIDVATMIKDSIDKEGEFFKLVPINIEIVDE